MDDRHGQPAPEDADDVNGLRTPKVKLSGEDGNSFAILGRCRRAAREAGWPPDAWEEFRQEATGGDYNHLLRTVLLRFDVE